MPIIEKIQKKAGVILRRRAITSNPLKELILITFILWRKKLNNQWSQKHFLVAKKNRLAKTLSTPYCLILLYQILIEKLNVKVSSQKAVN